MTGAVSKLMAWENPGTGSSDGKEYRDTLERGTHSGETLWMEVRARLLPCAAAPPWAVIHGLYLPGSNPSST